MKKKNLFISLAFVSIFSICCTITSTAQKVNACGEEMTAEEMAMRALDVQEIQNIMGLHQLYGSPGGDHAKEIELIWSHERDDITFAGNHYVVKGDIEVIKAFYAPAETSGGGGMMQAAAGNTSFRALTTPIIEIAGDRQTAKAYWYTPGWQASIQNGEGSSIWTYEKYGIDFIMENGEWKIWHFHVYNDWEIPMGSDLAQYAIEQSKGGGAPGGMPQGDAPEGEMPEGGAPDGEQPQGGGMGHGSSVAEYYTSYDFNESYSVDREPNPLNPLPPMPYCTFSETFSY